MKMFQSLLKLSLTSALAVTVFLCGCGGGAQTSENSLVPTVQAKLPPFPATTAKASVSGKVTFDGAVPAPKKIRVSGDAVCEKAHPGSAMASEDLLVGADKAIENVIVWVKQGADQWEFPIPATPVKILQKGCQYSPHVVGVMAGQGLEISSEDATTHNVHFVGKANQEFNMTQKQGGKEVKVFKRQEIARIKCDIHSWMGAQILVAYHPFYQVTGKDGKFSLGKLPAGHYTIEAVHEKLGSSVQEIDLKDGEAKAINFAFKPKP